MPLSDTEVMTENSRNYSVGKEGKRLHGEETDEETGIRAQHDGQAIQRETTDWSWITDLHNPYNWPKWKKNVQLVAISVVSFSATVTSSIISPSHQQLMDEFGVSSTVAFLPLTLYVLALALGPVLGGPLSEVAGRQAVWYSAVILGGIFCQGSGFAPNLAALGIMRFFAGFFYAPSLAIGNGVLIEIYTPVERGLPSSIFILFPFLGPGLGPVLGAFITTRAGWRWTQYVPAIFSAFSLLLVMATSETYHPVLKRHRMKELGLEQPAQPPLVTVIRQFVTVGLLRPIHMLLTEPIITCLCLYVGVGFSVLFSFFGSFFYIFQSVYGFTIEQSGLVFLAIALGGLVGVGVVSLCDVLLYRPQVRRHPPHQVPPEHRLYPGMVGGVLLPISLFWFAWTTRPIISPSVPIVAVALFGVANITLFISAIQYQSDVYHHTNVASAASANSLARYSVPAAFPLFSLQMYRALGIGWATSLLGFVTIALLPVPFLLFRFGRTIRGKSSYETASY